MYSNNFLDETLHFVASFIDFSIDSYTLRFILEAYANCNFQFKISSHLSLRFIFSKQQKY